MRPKASDLPVVKLSEIEQVVANNSASVPLSLFSLLPNSIDQPASHIRDIRSLLDTLEERKAVLVLHHLDSEDPWVVFDELKLITQIDGALIHKAMRLSANSYFNPAIMSIVKLVQCLTPLSNHLGVDVLLNILHHFMIVEVMARGNDTNYFLPSVLKISPSAADIPPLSWNINDSNYTLAFAQCILPQTRQLILSFMPRFLYFLLYEIFSSAGDFQTVIMSHSALQMEIAPELQVYITIDSSAIVINMRCSESGIFSCLKCRNFFESIIRQQMDLLQPNMRATEYIVPMENLSLPVKQLDHIQRQGIQVRDVKNALTVKPATTATTHSMLRLRSFEPYEWLSKLEKPHLDRLLDHRFINAEVSKPFIHNLSKCVGESWKKLLEFSDDLQNCELSSSGDDRNTEEGSSSDNMGEAPQRPTYGKLLEIFSSMSIFQNSMELTAALKGQNVIEVDTGPSDSPSEDEGDPLPVKPQVAATLEPEGGVIHGDSASTLPPSSSPSSGGAYGGNTRGSGLSLTDGVTLKTCSTSSDASSLSSTIHLPPNVPSMVVTRAPVSRSDSPQGVQFVTKPQVLKCTSAGGTFMDDINDISFVIPPQAVRDGAEIAIQYAVAVGGPFTYPDHLIPVSPILWVCARGQESLRKPLQISTPHSVSISQKQTNLLHILCAQDQGDICTFSRSHKKSRIQPDRGILHTNLSKPQYFFCIAATRCKEVVSRTQYCIVKVAPNPFQYSWKLYFFVTYALPSCIQLVRQQFNAEHLVQETAFQFDTSHTEDPSITLEHIIITPEQWTVEKEGTHRQIKASQVEFGNESVFN
jgi:hypothetical protein